MTYKVYIKQDYKAKVARGQKLHRHIAYAGVLGLTSAFLLLNSFSESGNAMTGLAEVKDRLAEAASTTEITRAGQGTTAPRRVAMIQPVEPLPEWREEAAVQLPALVDEMVEPHAAAPAVEAADENTRDWREVTVKRGDNMALIFKRLDLGPRVLHNIMTSGEDAKILKSIMPGQTLRFDISDGKLQVMEYDISPSRKLVVSHDDDTITTAIEDIALEKKVRHAAAAISSSLYLAGHEAGLSDKLIMEMVTIYGWDIDFALDIRQGDRFTVMFEEYYKDGVKVEDGPILAAEFTNRGKTFKTVRFTHEDGDSQYYSDSGHSMRKAFLRTPVKFSRISSRFNLNRRHPILNTIRAHKGVDYAAPTGTPIKATGDGVVTFKGTKGGYGRTVAIRHGSTYSTLYAHMSRYGKGIRNGVRIKQGQTIGYIGSSGLATGPHLHYEFRVHGVHRNPLTVDLPKAARIPDELMDEFVARTRPLLAQLDEFSRQTEFAAAEREREAELIAMNKEKPDSTVTR